MNLLNITVLPEYQHCHVTNAALLDLTHVDTCFLSWLCLEMFLWVCEVLSTASANTVLYNKLTGKNTVLAFQPLEQTFFNWQLQNCGVFLHWSFANAVSSMFLHVWLNKSLNQTTAHACVFGTWQTSSWRVCLSLNSWIVGCVLLRLGWRECHLQGKGRWLHSHTMRWGWPSCSVLLSLRCPHEDAHSGVCVHEHIPVGDVPELSA